VALLGGIRATTVTESVSYSKWFRIDQAGNECPGPIIAQEPNHGGTAHYRLDDGQENDPENQCPQDLPGHRPGQCQCVSDSAYARPLPHDLRISFLPEHTPMGYQNGWAASVAAAHAHELVVGLSPTSARRHEGKDFWAVRAPDVRDHEHGSCWIAAIVHRSTDIQNGRRCARRPEGTGGWC
jgi:hypothetical protein